MDGVPDLIVFIFLLTKGHNNVVFFYFFRAGVAVGWFFPLYLFKVLNFVSNILHQIVVVHGCLHFNCFLDILFKEVHASERPVQDVLF